MYDNISSCALLGYGTLIVLLSGSYRISSAVLTWLVLSQCIGLIGYASILGCLFTLSRLLISRLISRFTLPIVVSHRCEKVGFEYVETVNMLLTTRPGVGNNREEKSTKTEGIYVFRK